MHGIFPSAVNFTILLAVLAYYLRQPIKQMIQQRHISLRDEVASVREKLRQANEKYDEFSSKLKAIDAEISALREQSKQDAMAARTRIVTEGKKLAETVVSDAKAGANAFFSELKSQLYYELAGRVLERSEVLLRERLTGDDRVRIRQEFSRQVETIQ